MSKDTKPPNDSGFVASRCSSCREQFEGWAIADPYAMSVERYPSDPKKFAWPGMYRDINTDLAWQAWQVAWKLGGAVADAKNDRDRDRDAWRRRTDL